MKRFAPFFIIGFVAVLTVGSALLLLRTNRHPVAASLAEPKDQGMAQTALGHARGPIDAPVLLEEFGDFQCPACAETSVSIRMIEQEFHDRLRLVFYEFPLAMHPHARAAATAAEAASAQGHFWEMHDLLYEHQAKWADSGDTSEDFEQFALHLHLNVTKFQGAMRDPSTAVQITSQQGYGVSRGVKNTPTLFFNGREFPPPFSPERLREGFAAAFAGKSKS